MKVTLDLDMLLAQGDIDQREYDKLRTLSHAGTASLAFNILVGFGVVAVAGATLALVPTAATAILLGAVIGGAGIALVQRGERQWRVLAVVCVVVGGLLAGGGIVKLGEGSVASFLLVTVLFAGIAAVTQSALMAALAVVALSSCLGARTGYFRATYFLGIESPLATIVLFAALAALLHVATSRLPAAYERVLTAATRTSMFLVNFGFWIASLWGDESLHGRTESFAPALRLEAHAFAIACAIALVAAGAFAWQCDRRWLVNVVAVFLAIDLYTQWFEWLGATPVSVLLAGLGALAFALALRQFNRSPGATA